MNFLSQTDLLFPQDLKSIHTFISGAASLNESVIQRLVTKYGENKRCIQAYGMTELSPLSHIQDTRAKTQKLGYCC